MSNINEIRDSFLPSLFSAKKSFGWLNYKFELDCRVEYDRNPIIFGDENCIPLGIRIIVYIPDLKKSRSFFISKDDIFDKSYLDSFDIKLYALILDKMHLLKD